MWKEMSIEELKSRHKIISNFKKGVKYRFFVSVICLTMTLFAEYTISEIPLMLVFAVLLTSYSLTAGKFWWPCILRACWFILPLLTTITILVHYILRIINNDVWTNDYKYIGILNENSVWSILSWVFLNMLLVLSFEFFNHTIEFDSHYEKIKKLVELRISNWDDKQKRLFF